MEKNTLRYSGIVFLAGASYGAQATTVKITYAAGFTWTQVAASQALFAALLFAVALLVQRARGKRLVPLSLKQTIALLALGLNTCIGTVLYNYALTLLPVSVAITLLFQFTWMGIVVHAQTPACGRGGSGGCYPGRNAHGQRHVLRIGGRS